MTSKRTKVEEDEEDEDDEDDVLISKLRAKILQKGVAGTLSSHILL